MAMKARHAVELVETQGLAALLAYKQCRERCAHETRLGENKQKSVEVKYPGADTILHSALNSRIMLVLGAIANISRDKNIYP